MALSKEPGSLLLPGDTIASIIDTVDAQQVVIRLGGGTVQKASRLLSSKVGKLCYKPLRNKLWIQSNQRRYVAADGDAVIGVVRERFGDEYRLDINGTDTATLPMLAFQGAVKKNKPNLQIGALVYCRVMRASKNMEAEVSCIEPGSTKSWSGGEALYGELQGGTVVEVSLGMASELITEERVLKMLGRIPFQSAVGVNGRIWIEAATTEHTMVLAVALAKADVMERKEWSEFSSKLLRQVGK